MENLLDHEDGRVTVRLLFDSKRKAYTLNVSICENEVFNHRFVCVPEERVQICNNTRSFPGGWGVTILAGDVRATLTGLLHKEARMIAEVVEAAYLTAGDHFLERGQMRLAGHT